MGRTFMFQGDSFGNDQDYETTYRKIGGTLLENIELHKITSLIYSTLLNRSRNPDFMDNMLTVNQLVNDSEFFYKYDSRERKLIADVFTNHECGILPDSCKQTLFELSKDFRLGVISNIWSDSAHFINYFKNVGIFNLFEQIIFSSDHGSAKPSKKLFDLAIEYFGKKPGDIVYIGDNYKRDVIGSRNAGMRSILIQNGPAGIISGDIQPDYIINGIEELIL